jgi:hypothetical protein
MDLREPCDGRWTAGAKTGAVARCFERETHHDIRRRHRVTGEPGMAREMRFDIVEMDIDHRLDALLRRLAEQGHARQHQLHQQWRHQRPFRIMQEVPIMEKGVAMGRRAKLSVRLFDQILGDRGGFGDHQPVILDHRRLPQRVDPPELRRREHRCLVPLIPLDRVGQTELLEQPQDSLRA